MKKRILMFTVFLGLLSSVIAAGDGPVSRISAEIISKVETQWKKMDKDDIVWQYRISLPFPADWPKKDTEYYYVYAAGQDVKNMIADGEITAAPWARIEISPAGQKLVLLSSKLKNIGTQGVRPLSAEESKIIPKQSEGIQKGYYCLWIKTNGVIADQIKPGHGSFFKWLECK